MSFINTMNNAVSTIHFISLNCQGLGDKRKRGRLIQYLNEQISQIVFLQETHFTENVKLSLRTEFTDWDLYHSVGESNSRGCTIMLSKTIAYTVLIYDTDVNGRYIILNVEC